MVAPWGLQRGLDTAQHAEGLGLGVAEPGDAGGLVVDDGRRHARDIDGVIAGRHRDDAGYRRLGVAAADDLLSVCYAGESAGGDGEGDQAFHGFFPG